MDNKDNILVLPPGPRCNRCGHVMCPMCEDSCDIIRDDDEQCCEGICDVSLTALKSWHEVIDPLIHASPIDVPITVAEGPCQWP